jgi:hypothetical protein
LPAPFGNKTGYALRRQNARRHGNKFVRVLGKSFWVFSDKTSGEKALGSFIWLLYFKIRDEALLLLE